MGWGPLVQVSPHPLVAAKLKTLRDKTAPPETFRQKLHELTVLLLYEALADLEVMSSSVKTPIATAAAVELTEKILFVPVWRAGDGMVQAALSLVTTATVSHVGVYRKESTVTPVPYYNRLDRDAPGTLAVILDPMLATGGTACLVSKFLKDRGARRVKYVGIIGAPEGVGRLRAAHPDVSINLAAIDWQLNDRAYIVPGLGDAGDRQFGTG